jgi:hypothetical protein
MMAWFLKFDALFAARFQKSQSCWLLNKLDTLQKHDGHQKTIVPSLGVAIGDQYYCNDATHYKNERAFIGQNSKTIMT